MLTVSKGRTTVPIIESQYQLYNLLIFKQVYKEYFFQPLSTWAPLVDESVVPRPARE